MCVHIQDAVWSVWVARLLIAGSECAPRGDAVNAALALQAPEMDKDELRTLAGILLCTTHQLLFQERLPLGTKTGQSRQIQLS